MRKLITAMALLFLAACQTVTPQSTFAARQVAVLKENGFVEVDGQWELGMSDRLLFASDESKLIPAQVENIGKIARALVAVDIHGARVDGHTDSTGSRSHNDRLSLHRARAVKDAMADGGMEAAAIHVFGMGRRHPIESNRTASGRQENRRVVIVISSADAR